MTRNIGFTNGFIKQPIEDDSSGNLKLPQWFLQGAKQVLPAVFYRPENNKDYRCYSPRIRRVIINYHVIFDEHHFLPSFPSCHLQDESTSNLVSLIVLLTPLPNLHILYPQQHHSLYIHQLTPLPHPLFYLISLGFTLVAQILLYPNLTQSQQTQCH